MQENENVGTRTKPPVGRTGSVCNFNHNENISANNTPSGQSYKAGGTRPIVTGTKAPNGRTGTVTNNVVSRDDARSNNKNVCA